MHSPSALSLGFLLLGAACAVAAAPLPTQGLPLSNWTAGSSLFWGGPQDGQDDPFSMRLPPGACGFGEMDSKMWPFFNVAGISPNNPLVRSRPQASCGTCLEVACTSPDPKVCSGRGSITVVVTDECPQCTATQINLHAFAFEQIAKLKYGSTEIRYRQVECSPADNITVRIDNFRVVQGGWLRLSLKSVASDGGIVSVELARSQDGAEGSNSTAPASSGPVDLQAQVLAASSGSPAPLLPSAPALPKAGANTTSTTNATSPTSSATTVTWKPLDNTYGAEWELSGLPTPPYDLRLTDAYGRKIVLQRVITVAGALGEFPGRAQFPPLDNDMIAAKQQEDARNAAALAGAPDASPVLTTEAPTTVVAAPKVAAPATVPTPKPATVPTPKPATAPAPTPAPTPKPVMPAPKPTVRPSVSIGSKSGNRRIL